ncbi:MAG TPA: hypothetical protein VGC91_09410 [Pyrinomonadaceae bacterium]|jgi:hypothetical protein
MSSILTKIIAEVQTLPLEEQIRVRTLSSEQQQQLRAALDKEALLRRIQGKYEHLTTSSEAFAARKAEEIALEDRRR